MDNSYSAPKGEDVVRLTDAEITEAFKQEAKVILPVLIADLKLERKKLIKKINDESKIINSESDDEMYRYLWKSWLELTLGEALKEIDKKTARLERQLRAVKGLTPANGLTDDLIRIAKAMPIESILNQPFRRTGSTLVGLCPFHKEKTPSFHIFKTNRGHCFGGCGKGGDSIDVYMLLNNCSFKEAVFALAGSQS